MGKHKLCPIRQWSVKLGLHVAVTVSALDPVSPVTSVAAVEMFRDPLTFSQPRHQLSHGHLRWPSPRPTPGYSWQRTFAKFEVSQSRRRAFSLMKALVLSNLRHYAKWALVHVRQWFRASRGLLCDCKFRRLIVCISTPEISGNENL